VNFSLGNLSKLKEANNEKQTKIHRKNVAYFLQNIRPKGIKSDKSKNLAKKTRYITELFISHGSLLKKRLAKPLRQPGKRLKCDISSWYNPLKYAGMFKIKMLPCVCFLCVIFLSLKNPAGLHKFFRYCPAP